MRYKAAMLATVGLAIAGSARAQVPSPGADLGVEEIVVTARKVEERLQDVPLSIRALTGHDLQVRGINSLSELSQFTPGLTYSPDFGRTAERPVIRGISALRQEAPQPVSIFVNGVFVRDAALGLVLDDAERIEIIKGPQSALYGRSTYAGAINYITVAPGNDLAGRVSLTAATANEFTAFGALTVPLVRDVLSARIRAKHYEFGGQYYNTLTNTRLGSEKTDSVGGEIRLTPSSSFDARVNVDYSKDSDGLFAASARTVPIQAGGVVTNQNGSTNVPNGSVCNGRTINIVGNNPATGLPDPAFPASLTTRLNGWPCGASTVDSRAVRRNEADLANYTDPATGVSYGNIAGLRREVFRATGDFNFRFGDGYQLSFLTGYTSQHSNLGADQSYNGTRFAPGFGGPATSWLTYDRTRLRYWSEELRLASPQDRPFTWLLGGYYYEEEQTGVTTGVIAQRRNAGPPVTFTEIVDPLRPSASTAARDVAGFARAQYAFGDRFKLSAEVRYGETRISVGGTPLATAIVTVGTCVAGQVCFVNGRSTFTDWAPRFTADYKLTESVLVYAQAAKGVKSGGFNSTPGLTADVFNYAGESVWSYELGLKSDLFDKRLRANFAIFQNDVDNLQLSNLVTYVSPFTGGSTTTTIVNNVGSARTRGFEVELVARPARWLTLSGNYAYTDAKALRGTEITNGTVFGGARSVAGFQLPRSPEHSAAGSAAIDVPVGRGLALFARTDVLYQSRRYAEIQNLIWADPFVHVNLSLGVAGAGWRLTGFVKNLGDDATSLNGFRYLDPATFRRTAVDFLPRREQFGVRLDWNF